MTERLMRNGCRLVIDTANPDWYRPAYDPLEEGEFFLKPRFGRLHRMLLDNGLGPNIAPHLEVHVQDRYPSSCPQQTSNGEWKGQIYLRATETSVFGDEDQRDAQLGHEFGHAAMGWTMEQRVGSSLSNRYEYRYARSLWYENRVDSVYWWSLDEIAAEDYRLICGSPTAISQRDQHMNIDLPDPRTIPALVDLLRGWREAL